jgi:hypothetical protein
MISEDKTYVTRCGNKVRIYAIDGWGAFPVHGAVYAKGRWLARSWTKDGCATIRGKSNNDLIELKPKEDMLYEVLRLQSESGYTHPISYPISLKETLTLRDQFAMHALNGLLAALEYKTGCDKLAREAYIAADAMLKAREEKKYE